LRAIYAGDGDLAISHAWGAALHECARMVLTLRKRVAELEAELAKLKGK